MKKIIFVLLTMFFASNVFSQGIEFEHGTFQDALDKAKAENKLVFMDCFTTWCGPCKKLSRDVFTQKEVGDFFNENFVNVKMDMEKGEGVGLAKKYGVRSFPTLLYLDGEGNVQHITIGASDATTLIGNAKIAKDPTQNWGNTHRKYMNGERGIDFLQEYILAGSRGRQDVSDAIEYYYSKVGNDELINKNGFDIISTSVKSVTDDKYMFVLRNKEKFYANVDKVRIDLFLESVMLRELMDAMKGGDVEFDAQKKELKDVDKDMAEKVIEKFEVYQLYRDADKSKYYSAQADFSLKYDFENSKALNRYAWMIVDAKVELGKEILVKAVKMAKRSVELDANFANLDTYAFALYKIGNFDQAMEQAKKSVELAPEENKKDLWSLKYMNGEL